MLIEPVDPSLNWDTQVSLKLLVESVPVAVVIVDRGGQIIYVNGKLEDLFGYDPDELLGAPVEILIPERFAHAHVRHRQVFVKEPRIRPMGSGMDLAGRRKGGSEFPIEVGLSYLTVGDELRVIATITDISKRKEVEEALEQRVEERTREIERRQQVSEGLGTILAVLNSNRPLPEILDFIVAQARRLLDADACCIYSRDERTARLIIQANHGLSSLEIEQMEMVLNRADAWGTLQTDTPMLFPEDGHALGEALPEALREHVYLAVALKDKEDLYGILLIAHSRARQISAEDTKLALNVAEQTKLAISNARLHAQIELSAMTAERNRIGRDLHDAVTQTLFSASMIAEVLPVIWQRNEKEGHNRLDELRTLTRGALAEMRTLLLELRPTKLMEVEMADLLHQLAEAIAGRARVPVDVDIVGEAEVPTDVKIAFYRIAQESLNNVAKHARAQHAQVRLLRKPDFIELHVADDGCGFVFERIAPEHLGLSIMRERADAIGATLEFQSRPHHGTSITARWTKSTRTG